MNDHARESAVAMCGSSEPYAALLCSILLDVTALKLIAANLRRGLKGKSALSEYYTILLCRELELIMLCSEFKLPGKLR